MLRVLTVVAVVACSLAAVAAVAALAAVAACSAPAKPHDAPKRRVIPPVAGAPAPLPFTSDCVAAGDPSLADLQHRADAATHAFFAAALANNHLVAITLAAHQDQLAEGLQQGPMLGGGKPAAPQGTAVAKQLDGAEGTFIAAETYWTGDPGGPTAWEFVQDDRGNVFRLIRKPLAAITQAFICTCREQRCGAPGSGCPACGSTNQILYGPLPSGTQYGGELELSYQANVTSIEYKQDACPPPPVCEQPP